MDTVLSPISAKLLARTDSLNAIANLSSEYHSLSNNPNANRFPLSNLANGSCSSGLKFKHRSSSCSLNSSSSCSSSSSFKNLRSKAVTAPLELGSCSTGTDPHQAYTSTGFLCNVDRDGGAQKESVPTVENSLTTTNQNTTTITTAVLTTPTASKAIPTITSNPASTSNADASGIVTAASVSVPSAGTGEILAKKCHKGDVCPSSNGLVNDNVKAAQEMTGQNQKHVTETGPRPVRGPNCKLPTIPAPAVASTSTSTATSIPLAFTPKGASCVADERTAGDIILHVTHKGDNTRNPSSSTENGSFSRSSSFSANVSSVRGGCLGGGRGGAGKYCRCYSKGNSSNNFGFKGCGCGGGGVTGDRVNFLDCLCTGTTELEEDLPYTSQLRGQEDSNSIW